MEKRKVRKYIFWGSLLFLAGFLICFLRTSYAIISPVMYTEDGSWTGQILKNGFWKTCLTAKGSYLVAGNILFLQFSWWLNRIVFGNNLTYLPVFIALLSYLYYVVLALLPVGLLKKTIDIRARIILFFAILLLPMGTSVSEIYGRISNIGYGCFFISFILLLYYFEEIKELNVYKKLAIYAGLLFCCVTNPTCYIVMAIILLWDFWSNFKEYGIHLLHKWQGILMLLAGMLTLLSLILMFMNKRAEIGQETVKIALDGVVEYFFRALAFVFVWPFYFKMNDVGALLVLLCIVLFFTVSFLLIKEKKYRLLLGISYGGTIFYTIITLFMRKTLTLQLVDYSTTFPDRYFYVQQLMVLLDLCIILSAAIKKKIVYKLWSKFVYGVYIYIGLLLVFNSGKIFELNHSQYVDCSVTFSQMIEKSYRESGVQQEYVVEIPISGFSIKLPAKYVEATIEYNESKK